VSVSLHRTVLPLGLALLAIPLLAQSHDTKAHDAKSHEAQAHGEQDYPPITLKQRLGPPPRAPQRTLHPDVPLEDAEGQLVIESGKPLSLMQSCGKCHDTEYIATHSYHATLGWDEKYAETGKAPPRPWDIAPGPIGRWDPLRYDTVRELLLAPWRVFEPARGTMIATDADTPLGAWIEKFGRSFAGAPAAKKLEFNCLLCHIATPNHGERVRELRELSYERSSMATLVGTGLVERDENGKLQWQRKEFDERGAVSPQRLGLGRPRNENCRACHMGFGEYEGAVHFGFGPNNRAGVTTGTAFAAGRIHDSGMNIAGKERLSTPWDVHAERLVSCSDCHHSPNSPVHAAKGSGDGPAHLRFDARRASTGDWLLRPSHDFVKGYTSQGTVANHLDGTMRGCADCHDAAEAHPKLPRQALHFETLTCTACHVPHVYGAPRRMTDWTLLGPDRQPLSAHRGADGDPNVATTLIEGYEPALLWQERGESERKLAPHNLMASWYWVGRAPETSSVIAAAFFTDGTAEAVRNEGMLRPVGRELLLRACFSGELGGYHEDLIHALDTNENKLIDKAELRLDTAAKVEAMRQRLLAVGVKDPEIRAELQPYTIAHGVQSTQFALRDCSSCHSPGTRVGKSILLADYVPGDVLPSLVADAGVLGAGSYERDDGGALHYRPETPKSLAYVLGAQPFSLLDKIGLLALILSTVGALLHGLFRILAARRRLAQSREGVQS
jgi:hypothetical protein